MANGCRNMWNVWRTVLEENEKLARAHLAAVEVFQQQIADDAKSLKMHKVQISKKVRSLSLANCPCVGNKISDVKKRLGKILAT